MGLYDDLATSPTSIGGGLFASSLSSKLGLPLPNPAPDIGKNLVNKNNRLIYLLQKKILVRGHLQTMWIIFWVFLTPPSPYVDHHRFFANPPSKPCGFFTIPSLHFK